ncbi:TetR/AcrR family transcriptional regulator [Promicromonospora sukumoe]|uniref:AcrR family transcriptional regulator n=1 Tax=Promicromonospora sukumoe TaxID=88382 RepID=A0A7W3JF71_9MICO|nr:TetR/AcrR family transcriptional regulator [Promicromonospora sukumoe]MBA8811684.1 AcrR family transcriptional regulator [Promicromonospora sukumoe]
MEQPADAPAPARRGGNGRAGRVAYDLDAVLAVAVQAFNERGYDATSMGELAERLGTSKSAIYYHVSGKQELLRLALERALGNLERLLEEPDADATALERLERVIRGAVRVLVDELPFVTLLLRLRGNTEIEREALGRRREFDHAVARLVEEAVADGALRSDVDARTATRLLFGMVNSLVEWYRPGGGLTADQLADAVVAMAFEGLRA